MKEEGQERQEEKNKFRQYRKVRKEIAHNTFFFLGKWVGRQIPIGTTTLVCATMLKCSHEVKKGGRRMILEHVPNCMAVS